MSLPAASAGLAEIDSVGINLPEPWAQLPDDIDDLCALSERLHERWTDEQLSSADRGARRALLRRVADVSSEGGVALAAMTFDLVRRAAVEPVAANEETLDATCTISIAPRREDVQHRLPGDDGATDEMGLPAVVDLPCGPALRRRFLVRSPRPADVSWYSDVFVVEPDAVPDLTIVVELNSTALTVTRELGELFADLARTLTLLTNDQPTRMFACTPINRPSRIVDRPTPQLVVHHSLSAACGSTTLGERRVVVGRASAASSVDVGIEHPLASRRHVEVWADDGAVLCRDLGSRNGTVRRRDGRDHPVGTVAPTLLRAGDLLVTEHAVELARIVMTGVTVTAVADGN